MLDDATVAIVKSLGGISAIGISHPHFYTTMVEWSRASATFPVHLHAAARAWISGPIRPIGCGRAIRCRFSQT